MRAFLASLVLVIILIVIGALAFIYSGVYDVAASAPEGPVTRWILATARERSIDAHAAGIQVPAGLDDPARLPIGVAHFAAHCAVCHGAPGVPRGDIGKGLNPQPADLARISAHRSPAELFWVIKHGIKMTGMPSWGDHSDDELWATVAFLKRLAGMTEQDYAKLVKESAAIGGHGDRDRDRTKSNDHSHH
jgi:mono/diheme cytochrome c family protein